MNRRTFLQSTAAGLALSAAPAFLRAQPAGKKYTTALVGSGWWGTNILREALASGHCTLVALCDVDPNQTEKCAAEIAKVSADQPRRYEDFRELIAKEKPEIVINATPDHWHALITIEAVKAGAHVYVEKPISHTINEGVAMVKAARAADRVVQVGTHRRVSPHNVSGHQFIRDGNAGKIGMVRCFVNYTGGAEKPEPNSEPPKGMNWDLWCGPAPLRAYNKKIHPKGFRQMLDYANGTLGDWGIHWLDQILWIMDARAPKKVFSTGGRPIKGPAVNDPARGQTTDAPDHQIAVYQFDDFDVSWEHRNFGGNHNEKADNRQPVGCYFYGTKGVFYQGWRDGWTFYPADGGQPLHTPPQLHLPDQQNIKELWADFIDAIKANKRPVCDIEVGHRSTTAALLGMLSMKLGRSVDWDAEKETIPNDPEAQKLMARDYRGPWKYPER